jgi:trans-feruloyl-CoA hydratase/vanillin synthase
VRYEDRYETVRVQVEDGIAWVELNRPEKRNAMNPTLNAEMVDVLLALDGDDECGVLVLTGAGDAWSAGMDLKEYFREVDGEPEHVQRRVRRDAAYWQWRLLRVHWAVAVPAARATAVAAGIPTAITNTLTRIAAGVR